MSIVSPVYLDNNATTAVDASVCDAMLRALKEGYGNPASVTHSFGWFAAELVKIAREQVATLLGSSPEEVVFTSGATESINLVLQGVQARPGATGVDEIVSSSIEHRATLDVLESLPENGRTHARIVPVRRDGSLDVSEILSACTERTKLVSLSLANNEIGTIYPLAALGEALEKTGILLHCDASQAAGKLPLDVLALKVDFLSLSAHKMYGPKGVGALFVKKSSRPRLRPVLFGGGHEGGLRPGTLNVPGIVGMGKAAELAHENLESESARLREHASFLLRGLQAQFPNLLLNGPSEKRLPGNLNLAVPGIDNARLVGLVQGKIAISTSSACQSDRKRPSHVLEAIGLSPDLQRASFRIGIGRMNTREEMEFALQVLVESIPAAQSFPRAD